ncbi:MAG TPA: response regulator [Rhodospirillaceae bacterium]|nr:response regulator [Rhodospirillaceae bacterium]
MSLTDAVPLPPSRPLSVLKGAILIIEDVVTTRGQMTFCLSEAGAGKIVEAEEGVTALQLLKDKPDHWAMVISDLEMGGLRLVRTLRSDPLIPEPLRRIPFIMLTEDTTLAAVSDIRAAGANGVVAKPFNSAKLIAAAVHVISARRK